MSTRDLINLGIAPDSGTGDSARRGGMKINTLFADIYAHFGDNPVGNNPAGSNYGYREIFGETDYKVGELHPAGRYIPVKFESSTGLAFDSTWGYGVSGSATLVDTNTSGTPDIYENLGWFFLSRGDSLGLDLRELNDSEDIHLVLPLAVPGDVIRVRDTFTSWGKKFINIWTTPYEFSSDVQVAEWEVATGYVYPDSESISINTFENGRISVPYKASISPNSATYPKLNVNFKTSSNNRSNVCEFDKELFELVFTYLGPRYGWSYQVLSLQNVDYGAILDKLKSFGVTVSDIAPTSPTRGDMWFDTSITGEPGLFVYSGTSWLDATGNSGGGSSVIVSDTVPTSPTRGDMWFDTSVTDEPGLFVYSGTAWLDATGGGSNNSSAPTGAFSNSNTLSTTVTVGTLPTNTGWVIFGEISTQPLTSTQFNLQLDSSIVWTSGTVTNQWITYRGTGSGVLTVNDTGSNIITGNLTVMYW